MSLAKCTPRPQHHELQLLHSAGGTLAQCSQHHEHQLHYLEESLPSAPQDTSIMSISCIRGSDPCQMRPKTPASRESAASGGVTLAKCAPRQQHHEHQLHQLGEPSPNVASIMSISCIRWCDPCQMRPKTPASRESAASGGVTLAKCAPRHQHHELQLHQLGEPSPDVAVASIMSNSCVIWRNPCQMRPKTPAS